MTRFLRARYWQHLPASRIYISGFVCRQYVGFRRYIDQVSLTARTAVDRPTKTRTNAKKIIIVGCWFLLNKTSNHIFFNFGSRDTTLCVGYAPTVSANGVSVVQWGVCTLTYVNFYTLEDSSAISSTLLVPALLRDIYRVPVPSPGKFAIAVVQRIYFLSFQILPTSISQ